VGGPLSAGWAGLSEQVAWRRLSAPHHVPKWDVPLWHVPKWHTFLGGRFLAWVLVWIRFAGGWQPLQRAAPYREWPRYRGRARRLGGVAWARHAKKRAAFQLRAFVVERVLASAHLRALLEKFRDRRCRASDVMRSQQSACCFHLLCCRILRQLKRAHNSSCAHIRVRLHAL